jgi:hypothetical protein
MDPAVLPDLLRQRRAPSAPRPRVQPRQLHADAGDAQDGAAVVTDQPAREADQDRREGGELRPLRDLSDGRGRGVAADVRRYPVPDRPAASTSRVGMRGGEVKVQRATEGEACLDAGQSAHASVPVPARARFDRLLLCIGRICRCPSRSEARSWPRNCRGSGECRLKWVFRAA